MKIFAPFLLASSAIFAQMPPLQELIGAARQGAPAPRMTEMITKTLGGRGGVAVWGQDYLFVSSSPAPVSLSLAQHPAVPMKPLEGSTFWTLLTKMRTGVTHSYQYFVDGKP